MVPANGTLTILFHLSSPYALAVIRSILTVTGQSYCMKMLCVMSGITVPWWYPQTESNSRVAFHKYYTPPVEIIQCYAKPVTHIPPIHRFVTCRVLPSIITQAAFELGIPKQLGRHANELRSGAVPKYVPSVVIPVFTVNEKLVLRSAPENSSRLKPHLG